MTDSRIEKLADVLVNYSAAVQPGDRVIIQASATAEPLIEQVYAQVLQAGGHPMVQARLPGLGRLFFQYASDKQLSYILEPTKLAVETFEASIMIGGSANTKALTNVDSTKMVTYNRARMEILTTVMRRISDGTLRWVETQFPTNAYAQDAEMSLPEYEELVYGACLPDSDDPAGYWQRFSAWQQKIVDWLAGKQNVRVTAPGTDLRMNIAGRTFINCDGRFNMPDGEVCTSPVEDSAEGHVYFSYPTIFQGREVTGVRLWFENGRVVKATAEKNEEFLSKILDADEGSRYLGEFAIGTNTGITRFTRSILFDEKISGSFHIALGESLPETGGQNESAIHWDMVCDLRDGGGIWVDDELLYQNGQFVLEF